MKCSNPGPLPFLGDFSLLYACRRWLEPAFTRSDRRVAGGFGTLGSTAMSKSVVLT
jgi:hypothetical protein